MKRYDNNDNKINKYKKGAPNTIVGVGTTVVVAGGWTPKQRTKIIIEDGEVVKELIEVYDYVGGSGNKPTEFGYLSPIGLTYDEEIATDFLGKEGPEGPEGPQGLTPYIGPNNNWWIGDVDTGVDASGAVISPESATDIFD